MLGDTIGEMWVSLTHAQLSLEELASLEEMYHESFPPQERRPWAQLLEGSHPYFAIRVLRSRGVVCGFVSLWQLPSMLFVEHLVVSPSMRGQGVGSKAMQSLLSALEGRPLVLEIEPPESSTEAERRRCFYEQLGLELLPYDYTQPPYTAGGEAVPLRLMASCSLTLEQINIIVDELYSFVYEVKL